MSEYTIAANPLEFSGYSISSNNSVPQSPISSDKKDNSPDVNRESGQNAQKSIYGEIPQIPVLEAVEGIRFDFNHGLRILFPHNGKEYHVTFSDSLCRTSISTLSAGSTFIIVDYSMVVYNMDSVVFTGLFAFLTSDTTIFADAACYFTDIG